MNRFFLSVIAAAALLALLVFFGRQTPMAAPAAYVPSDELTPATPVSFYETSSTSKEIQIAGLNESQYKPVQLADVKDYASISVNNYVVTSGIVVGVASGPSYELVLGDSKGHYLVVSLAAVQETTFGPVYTSLKNGDTVELKGIADRTQCFLVTASTGATLSCSGDTASNPFLGMLNLTGIKKVK